MKRAILHHGVQLLESYRGDRPFADSLRDYFRSHPRLGSRDRRWIREIGYNYLRWGKGFPESLPLITRIQASLFMASIGDKTPVLPDSWTPLVPESREAKQAFLLEEGVPFDPRLGWTSSLSFSPPLDRDSWLDYIKTPAQVFLRLHREEEEAKSALDKAGISWSALDSRTLVVDRGAPVDRVLPPGDYRIQDASSQACGTYFRPRPGERWWDCCCGAGGKAMLLLDKEMDLELWMSDSRKKAIQSLTQRWASSPYPRPHRILTGTVSRLVQEDHLPAFDHIIADLPCSGSGTWARTPENFAFFQDSRISEFSQKQESISRKAIEKLKPGGILHYITCSVFREENEEVVRKLTETGPLVLMDQQIVHRGPYASDYLFLARLRKSGI